MIKQQKKSRIPEFASVKQEAKFWDTHSFTDYLNEMKPVKARFTKNLTEVLPIRLDPVTIVKIREQARKKGVGPTTLIRMWVLEHLHENESKTI